MTPDEEARFVGAFILVPLLIVGLLGGIIIAVRWHETHSGEVRIFDGGP